jgi:hypothetical protein
MKNRVGLILGLLSINAVYSGEEMRVASGSSEELEAFQDLPEVTRENFAVLLPRILKEGGLPLVKTKLTISSLENRHQFFNQALNPSLDEQKKKRIALPLEYAVRIKDEGLMVWLLRNGAEPEVINRFGHPVNDAIEKTSFGELITKEMKLKKQREKIEPLVIEALQGVSVETVASRLKELLEQNNDLDYAKIENVLIQILKDYENDAALLAKLISAYQGQTSVKSGKGFDGYVPLLGGITIGATIGAVGVYLYFEGVRLLEKRGI